MTRALLFILAAMALAPAAAEDGVPYRLDIEIARQGGDMRHVSSFETSVLIVNGPFVLSRESDGKAPVLRGAFAIDPSNNEIAAVLVVCAPDKDPCTAIAEPAMTFRAGEPAAIDIDNGKQSISISFQPLEG